MNFLRYAFAAMIVAMPTPPVQAREIWVDHVYIARLDLNGTYGCTMYNGSNGSGARWRIDGKLNQTSDNKPFLSKRVAHMPAGLLPASLQCDANKWARCQIMVYSAPSHQGQSDMFHGVRGMVNLADFGWPSGRIKSLEIRCQPAPASASSNIQFKEVAPAIKKEMAGARHGCTVYLDPNGGGQRWDAFVTIPRAVMSKKSYSKLYNSSPAWDRRISSLKCDADAKVDCSVAIYSDTNRRGQNATLYGRMGLVNLSQYGWDDRIRSLEVFCARR